VKLWTTVTVFALALALFVHSEASAMEGSGMKTPANPYAQWENGPSADPGYFPIGVWAQDPRNAAKYRDIGVNLYLSLPGGPTAQQLADLRKAGLKTICHQNQFGLANLDDSTVIGWMHGDEPDNFTRDETGTKWVPKKSPQQIIADYKRVRQNDPSRPVLLNLGQGVANDYWKGGWAKEKDYIELVKGCDIVSYDIYPMCSSRKEVAGKMELIGLGVERLRKWTNDEKIVWFITEATHIQNETRMATPEEIRSEVWMAIIHGARGIIYFCHQWKPTKDFAFPIHDPVVKETLTVLNAQIMELAPVLNSPTIEGLVSVTSANPAVPVKTMVKRYGGDLYVFAISMRPDATAVTFQIQGLTGDAEAEIVGENATVKIKGGRFTQTYADYAAHIYRVKGAGN